MSGNLRACGRHRRRLQVPNLLTFSQHLAGSSFEDLRQRTMLSTDSVGHERSPTQRDEYTTHLVMQTQWIVHLQVCSGLCLPPWYRKTRYDKALIVAPIGSPHLF